MTSRCPAAALFTAGPDHSPLAPSGGRHLAKANSEIFEGAVFVSLAAVTECHNGVA